MITDKKDFIKRVIQYGIGLLIVAFGISISIKSALGVSPVSSLPYVFSLMTNIPFSVCSSSFYVAYIGVQWLILRKQFKITLLFQMIPAIAFGFFVDLSDWMLAGVPSPEMYVGKIVYIAISIVLIAIGVRMYFGAKLVNMPSEGIANALIVKFGFPLNRAKLTFDVSSVALALILSFIVFGGMVGVGVGTILIALGVGNCIKVINMILAKFAKPKTETVSDNAK